MTKMTWTITNEDLRLCQHSSVSVFFISGIAKYSGVSPSQTVSAVLTQRKAFSPAPTLSALTTADDYLTPRPRLHRKTETRGRVVDLYMNAGIKRRARLPDFCRAACCVYCNAVCSSDFSDTSMPIVWMWTLGEENQLVLYQVTHQMDRI